MERYGNGHLLVSCFRGLVNALAEVQFPNDLEVSGSGSDAFQQLAEFSHQFGSSDIQIKSNITAIQSACGGSAFQGIEAAHSLDSRYFDAFCEDLDMLQSDLSGTTKLVNQPVWKGSAPSGIQGQQEHFFKSLNSFSLFEFWSNWYRMFLNGDMVSKDFLHRLVTHLHEEDWRSRPADIDRKIEELNSHWESKRLSSRPRSTPEIRKNILTGRVLELIANPAITELTANGAAEVLERGIVEFLTSTGANCLPDELAHLEALPPIFRRISELSKAEIDAEAKERELAAEIERLNAKVAELETALKVARSKSLNGRFSEAYITALGKTMGVATPAALALGTTHFFGIMPTDLTLENFRLWLEGVSQEVPAPDGATGLPSATDV